MDHPNVAFAYKIEAKASGYNSYKDEDEEESESRWHDMCGIYIFDWGFFCDFSEYQ